MASPTFTPEIPPVAPAIAAQQAPMAAYAQNLGTANTGPTGAPNGIPVPDPGQSSMGFVVSILTDVANGLEKAAKVLVVEKPELLPILKVGVQALTTLMSQVQSALAPNYGMPTEAQPTPGPSAAVSTGM